MLAVKIGGNAIKEILYENKSTGVWVTESGELLSYKKIIKLYPSGSGYLTFGLCAGFTKDGKPTTIRRYLHRVVAEAFIPNPTGLPQVNHKDGNKSNNHYLNLEWISSSKNIKHAHEQGLTKNRAIVKPIRLTQEEIIEYYTRVTGGESIQSVAKSSGRPRTTISSLINKRCHVETTDKIDKGELCLEQ